MAPRQLNVQVKDELGAPLTLGVRLNPKFSRHSQGTPSATCYGIDIILYADLWLLNQTALPLVFGCPSMQLYTRRNGESSDQDNTPFDDIAGRIAAEAALMEIASVLEFGDKGKNLINSGDDSADSVGDVHLLPYQHCTHVCEEVFEYLEIESSTVKRRWWASEKHDSLRQKPSAYVDDSGDWQWLDNCWVRKICLFPHLTSSLFRESSHSNFSILLDFVAETENRYQRTSRSLARRMGKLSQPCWRKRKYFLWSKIV